MPQLSLIQSFSLLLGMAGLVSVRMFLPTFLSMLVLRFHPLWTWGKPELVAQLAEATPPWLLHPAMITFMGFLSLLELIAMRVPIIRSFLDKNCDKYAKPVIALLLSFAFLHYAAYESATETAAATVTVSQAGLSLSIIGSLFFAAITHFLTILRSSISTILMALDPENTLHLRTLTLLLEESWCVFGLFALLLAPLPAIILFIFFWGMLYAANRSLALLENSQKHSCDNCGNPVPNSALQCPSCLAIQPETRKVNLWGVTTRFSIGSSQKARLNQEYHLRAVHRCRICAAPLHYNNYCPLCNSKVFPAKRDVIGFIHRYDRRVIKCYVIFFCLCLLPFFGFILSAALNNVLLLRPLRLYMNFSGRIFARMASRVLFIILFALAALLSFIPFSAPVLLIPMAVSYWVTRKAFLSYWLHRHQQ